MTDDLLKRLDAADQNSPQRITGSDIFAAAAARILSAVEAVPAAATRTYTSGAASVAVCPICDITGCHHLRATNGRFIPALKGGAK